MRTRTAITAITACGALVGLGGGAAAAAGPTAVLHGSSEGIRLYSVVAAAGAQNALSVNGSPDGRHIVIRDTRAGVVSATERCLQEGPVQVRCSAAGTGRIEVMTGDMADGFAMEREDFPSYDLAVDTGADDDVVRLGFKPADIDNSTVGQVVVRTSAGEDAVRLGFKPADVENSTLGEVVMDTGADADSVGVDWVGFKPGDLENSTIGEIVARLGTGPDRLELSGPGTGHGGPGNDVLLGGSGTQHLFGEEGEDFLAGGDGPGDHCDGGDGADVYGPGCETAHYTEGDTGTHELGPAAG